MNNVSRDLGSRIVMCAALAAMSATASAANINWVGGASGAATDFNNPANWAGGNLPVLYNEVPNTENGDIAVFDTATPGLNNQTPTMTGAYGTGVGNGVAGSASQTWGLLGVKFVGSGWTFDTGANTLYVSHRGTVDIRSEATSGTNTINGNVRFGAWDTNAYSHLFVATGGTLRLNSTIGIAVDGGSNTSGGYEARGGGTLELNTTGNVGSAGLRIFEGTTVRLFSQTIGGVTGNGLAGLGADNRTLTLSNGTLDVNGAAATLTMGSLDLQASGVLTNGSATTETIAVNARSSQVLAGLISGNLNMSFGAAAAATTTVNNNNSYTGTTVVTSGAGTTHTVVVGQSVLPNTNSPFGNSATAVTLGNSGNNNSSSALLTNGAIEFGRPITLAASTHATATRTIGAAATQVGNSTFSGAITVGTASQASLTVTAPTNVTVNITGDILESPNVGNGAVNKTGLGTVTFSGSNTYAGGTTVTAGQLLVNNTTGSGTGTGNVSVLDAATLGGTGSISGSVLLDGTLLPTLATNALDILGTLTVDDSSKLDLGALAGLNASTTYTVVTYGTLAGVFTASNILNLPESHEISFDTAGQIQLVPVPEPAALSLLGLMALPALRRRRR